MVDHAGQPVPSATVYVISAPVALPDIALLSALDGSFALAAPVAGRYVLGARSDDAGSGQTTTIAPSGDEIAIEITIKLSDQATLRA